jgi:SAM-dependent methyltransferase
MPVLSLHLPSMSETSPPERPDRGNAESGGSGSDDFQQRDDFGNFEANLYFLDAVGALAPPHTLLEVGCGKGRLIKHLLDTGHDIRGCEVNQFMLDEGRRLYGPLPIDKIDGSSLPYQAGTFDVLLSFDVLEHIPDSDAHLREVARVLKPGGSYLLQTPNKWTNTVFETIRWRSLTAWRQEHCSLHSARQIESRLSQHGFETRFYDVPVVTDFFRRKVRFHLGWLGAVLLRVINLDRWPRRLRTNFYIKATKTT